MVNGIGLDRGWRVSFAIPMLIGGNHAKPGVGKRGELMSPRIPQLRKPVTQQHREALTGLDHVHTNTIGLYVLVSETHGGTPFPIFAVSPWACCSCSASTYSRAFSAATIRQTRSPS